MRFSQWSALNVVPLLARIILAAAFITLGWNKLFTDTTFQGKDLQRLMELGVIQSGAPRAAAQSAWEGSDGDRIVLTSMLQQPAGGGSEPAGHGAAGPSTEKPATTPAMPPAVGSTPSPISETPASNQATARSLHQLTLQLDARGLQYPRTLAWLVSASELVGGVLLLVGLFSRLWGLTLAIIMAAGFYHTSLETVLRTWVITMTPNEFNTAFRQVGLLVLAVGVLLSGPGGLSLDRLMFRSSPKLPPAPRPQAMTAPAPPTH